MKSWEEHVLNIETIIKSISLEEMTAIGSLSENQIFADVLVRNLKAQTEISFKVGQRSVVEWVEAQNWKSTRNNSKWQAFKEGIE